MLDNKCNKAMKSKTAKEFINGLVDHIRISMFDEHDRQLVQVEIGDHAKEQLLLAMTHAVELAEQEAEERMQTKAHNIVKEMMTGIFHGDMPRKIADEFIQKLTDDETD